ncbi:MAG TPA: hypothetical protein VMM14_00260 [Acidimicrobiia bacterium]|nr:hypothetical protein [Acidimicrobiia bacterium]
MAKFVLAYHGGGIAETEEEQAEVMAAWGAWMEGLGSALKDPGNPSGARKTIAADGSVSDGGGANPVTGYSILEAGSLDEAVTLAKSNPVFASGGSIEVIEAIEM